jgi:hypothetical protein
VYFLILRTSVLITDGPREGYTVRIPGLSFSWKRAAGITAAKQKLSRAVGIPLTKQARQRKAGALLGAAAWALLLGRRHAPAPDDTAAGPEIAQPPAYTESWLAHAIRALIVAAGLLASIAAGIVAASFYFDASPGSTGRACAWGVPAALGAAVSAWLVRPRRRNSRRHS